jgi:hypothetical protein
MQVPSVSLEDTIAATLCTLEGECLDIMLYKWPVGIASLTLHLTFSHIPRNASLACLACSDGHGPRSSIHDAAAATKLRARSCDLAMASLCRTHLTAYSTSPSHLNFLLIIGTRPGCSSAAKSTGQVITPALTSVNAGLPRKDCLLVKSSMSSTTCSRPHH